MLEVGVKGVGVEVYEEGEPLPRVFQQGKQGLGAACDLPKAACVAGADLKGDVECVEQVGLLGGGECLVRRPGGSTGADGLLGILGEEGVLAEEGINGGTGGAPGPLDVLQRAVVLGVFAEEPPIALLAEGLMGCRGHGG